MQAANPLSTVPALTPIKGYKGQEQQLQQYVNAAYAIICTALFDCTFFSANDRALAKKAILQWLLQQSEAATAYSELVQRVLHARKEHGTWPKQLPTPAAWLGSNHALGFGASAQWYGQLQSKRLRNPVQGAAVRSLAEALLAMQEDPTALNFHYWRSWFAQREQHGLLNLFLSCLAWQALEDGMDDDRALSA